MFAVVGDSNLLFSVELANIVDNAVEKSYLFQFVLYASLDSLDLSNRKAFRDTIDTYENYSISAYVTIGQTVFLLLHPKKKTDTKKFFQQVHTLYAELLMNPFYEARSPIEDETFRRGVIDAARLLN